MAAAASRGHISVVKLLIKAGANLDQEGVGGEGPALYAAVSAGNTEIVKLLLDAGASLNACEDLSGICYAVDVAAVRADLEQISFLFAKDNIGQHDQVGDEILCLWRAEDPLRSSAKSTGKTTTTHSNAQLGPIIA